MLRVLAPGVRPLECSREDLEQTVLPALARLAAQAAAELGPAAADQQQAAAQVQQAMVAHQAQQAQQAQQGAAAQQESEQAAAQVEAQALLAWLQAGATEGLAADDEQRRLWAAAAAATSSGGRRQAAALAAVADAAAGMLPDTLADYLRCLAAYPADEHFVTLASLHAARECFPRPPLQLRRTELVLSYTGEALAAAWQQFGSLAAGRV